MNAPDSPHPAAWRLLGVAAVLLLLAGVVTIALISAGTFDPAPAGPLQAQTSPGEVAVYGESEQVLWQAEPDLPAPPYSVHVTATVAGGSHDVRYGIALGEPGDYLVVTIAPAGYASVSHRQRDGETILFPWQPSVHAARGGDETELWLDVGPERVTVWVNRERLWQGERSFSGSRVALVARGYGEASTLHFSRLDLYAP